jgi:Tfp pilus assembly PilM family ATPase/Tfp pilus assembly protein PilN
MKRMMNRKKISKPSLPHIDRILNTRNAIVVEWDQESLAAVEVADRNNGAEVIRFTVRAFPAGGMNAAWLRAIWQQEHFSERRVICCLPAALVEYKLLVMPALPTAQLEEAVKIEINNGDSSNSTGLVKIIDWRKRDQMVLVNVALVKLESLANDFQVIKQAGLELEWTGVRYQGLRNFINFNRNFLDETTAGTIYLDIGKDATELGIVKNEILVYRRELDWGCSALLNEPKPLETDSVGSSSQGNNSQATLSLGVTDLIEEVRLSLAAFKADAKDEIPSKLEVFGKIEAAPMIRDSLFQEMGLHLYTSEKTKLGGVITHKHTPRLAPLLGLALDHIKVMPPEATRIYTPEQDRARWNREKVLLGIGAVITFSFVLIGLIMMFQASSIRNRQLEEWLQHHSASLNELRRSERQIIGNSKQIQQLDFWLAKQNQELEFLLLLQNNLPDGTQITDLTIENGIVKDLSGVTPSVSLLLNKFRTVPGLRNLKVKGTIASSPAGEVFQMEGMILDKEQAK